MTVRIAIIGYGKIARDQHVPAIASDPRFELVAVVSPHDDPGLDLPRFATTSELLTQMRGELDAVAICTPPQARHAIAVEALAAGLSVLLEKPPAATLGEIDDLGLRAASGGCGLYAAWHSQHAAGVSQAARLLAGEAIARLDISWFEDVRKWHPDQEWIWSAGGFGVFDPGINALSIATKILPMPLLVRGARLLVPANRASPIAAEITFAGDRMQATFDWRHSERECWTIAVETATGTKVLLEEGGARLTVNGIEHELPASAEYPSIYASFAEVAERRQVLVDSEPLRIVADAFLVGERTKGEPFA